MPKSKFGFKACMGNTGIKCIVKLEIPKTAIIFSSYRKKRCNCVRVIAISGNNTEATSMFSEHGKLTYKIGEIVAINFCASDKECGMGIHYFDTLVEAADYAGIPFLDDSMKKLENDDPQDYRFD